MTGLSHSKFATALASAQFFRVAASTVLTAVLLVLAPTALAQPVFNIATGGPAGAYYPIGQAMAAALSEPGQVNVQAQATSGSLANVSAVGAGQLDSRFSQADVAAWHYRGTGPVKPAAKLDKLRLMATLYPEQVHVVVRKSLNVTSVAQLKGLRVALDEPGSGVLLNARQILRAYGLTERDIVPSYIKGARAAERMKEGALDALFYVGGVPSGFVKTLATDVEISLLPIDGKEAELLRASNAFFTADAIAESAYPGTGMGTGPVPTLAVSAQWVTHAKADSQLVYNLTKKLFGPAALAFVQASHPSAQAISLKSAVLSSGLPLHPGAERFYREAGALK
jgi:uncharacterized protein